MIRPALPVASARPLAVVAGDLALAKIAGNRALAVVAWRHLCDYSRARHKTCRDPFHRIAKLSFHANRTAAKLAFCAAVDLAYDVIRLYSDHQPHVIDDIVVAPVPKAESPGPAVQAVAAFIRWLPIGRGNNAADADR